MASGFKTLNELFIEDEAKRLAKAREEMAAEWKALPQSEKDRIIAEYEAKWEIALEASIEEEDEEDGEA